MKGFQIRKRVTRLFRPILRRRRRYARIHSHPSPSSIFTRLRQKASTFLSQWAGSGYARVGQKRDDPVRVEVPKGHLAVYVGQKEDDCCRVVVPIIYFNHPLFGRLLGEAEEKFGFHHPGRITIPCPVSEFRTVTTRIEAAVRRRR